MRVDSAVWAAVPDPRGGEIMSPSDLKPCPFCGREAFRDNLGTHYWVLCSGRDDDCPADVATRDYATREAADAAWNTRRPGREKR